MKKRVIYISLIIILLFICITTFSYSFFLRKDEYSGKLNIIVGTLEYKIYSNELSNGKIILEPNSIKEFEIEIKSLNDIPTKYELYYETTNNNVIINYQKTTENNSTGVINENSNIIISIRVANESNENATVIFKVSGGLANDELVLNNVNHITSICDSITTFCISTPQQLITLANEVNAGDNKEGKIYYLENDLDLGGKFDSEGNMLEGSTNWEVIGKSSLTPFSGIFDGNGYIIKNLYLNNETAINNQNIELLSGLFGKITNAVIRNVGLENSYIKGYSNQAGITGAASNSIIDKVYNKATVIGEARTAGICGSCGGTIVKNSYNGGIIKNNSNDLTGGIIGGWGEVKNSYNYGEVSSNANSIGGILGWSGNVYNSYNLGTVTSYRHCGGILGGATVNNIVNNSYNSGLTSSKCGGIIGYEYEVGSVDNMSLKLSNNYYMTGTANFGFGAYETNTNSASPLEQNQMPSVIEIINQENVFINDQNDINSGYPILKWEMIR